MIYTQPTIYQTFYNATFYSKLNHAYLLVSNQNKLDDKIIKFILNVIVHKKEAFTSPLNDQITNHSNIFSFDTNTQFVSKNDLLNLLDHILLSSFKTQVKILYIKNIENLQQETSNLLLKILEDPPKNTYFIFTTFKLNAILSTIKSRCQEIKVRNKNMINFLEQIIENKIIDSKYAFIFSYISDNLDHIKTLIEQDYLTLYKKIIDYLNLGFSDKNLFYIKLNKLLNKNNYQLVIKTLVAFFYHVYQTKNNINWPIETYHDFCLKKFLPLKIKWDELFLNIDKFFKRLNWNTNFLLNKSSFLLFLTKYLWPN